MKAARGGWMSWDGYAGPVREIRPLSWGLTL